MKARKDFILKSMVVGLIASLLAACSTPTPTALPTLTATPTPAPTPTSVPTPTPSPTPSPVDPVSEGDASLRGSDFEGAIAAYQQAIEIDPSYGPAYTGLSQVYLWQGVKESEALAQAEKGVELAPESTIAYAVLAHAQIARRAPAEALEAAERAAELDPQSALAQAWLARAYLLDRQYDLAQQAAERAVSLNSELADAYFALGRFYEGTADFARARAAYEHAVMLEPEFVGWHIALGWLWQEGGHYEEADTAFEQALELAPDHVPALMGLAYGQVVRRAYVDAERQIEQMIALAPDEPGGYVTRGYLYQQQDEHDKALEQFNQALDLDSDDYGIRLAIGDTYLYQGECEQAEAQFQELAAEYPRIAAPRVGRGYAEFCVDDVRKGLSHFRDAAEMEPYSAQAHIGLGDGYGYQERWDEARQAHLEALRLSPAPARVHASLGTLFWSQGMVEEAEAEFRIALNLNPYLQEVYLSLGEMLQMQERRSEALEVVEEAIALDAENLDAKRLLGIIHFLMEEPEQAVDALEQVLEDDPEDELSYVYLGLAHRDLGDYRQAKKELETFVTLAGDYYGEDVVSRLGFLIDILEQGYTISEERAMADIKEVFEVFFEQAPDAQLEDTEEGRTLVVTVAASAADLENEDGVFAQVGEIAGLTALFVPRVDPPITNGLLIRVKQWGETLFTLQTTLSALRQYADAITSADTLIETFEISLGEKSDALASIEEIKRSVAELRELEIQQAVPYQTLAQADVREHLTDNIDEEVQDSLRRDESMLSLLGVITPGLDLEEVWVNLYSEQVAGFYSLDEEMLYVVEQEEETASDQMVLAHEYVHALQDQAFGLDRSDDPDLNDDQRLAFEALIEGDATLTAALYAEENISTVDRLDAASKSGGMEREVLDATPSFIREMSIFPYDAGLEFVIALYQRDGSWEKVNEAFADPPQSTEQILHPERYWDGDLPQVVALPDMGAQLGDAWREVGSEVLGELGVLLTLSEHVGPAAAMDAAEGWDGDRYLVLQNEAQDAHAVVIRTIWDDQDESDEFWTFYQTMMAHRAGYTEVIETLVGELKSHWWEGEADCVYASQDDAHVTIVVGSVREHVEQIVAQLP